MKKLVPFKKELFFKENIEEITSISLEQSLHQGEHNQIIGEFFINGEYKVTNQTDVVDKFEFNIPVEIAVDDKYNLENVVIDIDDFYYEIFDSNVLLINIEVLLDKLEEIKVEVVEEIRLEKEDEEEPNIDLFKELEEFDFEEPTPKIVDQLMVHPPKVIEIEDSKIEINEEDKEYNTYKIYIVNEGDNVDYIVNNYHTTREILEQYNSLEIINIGDKIIIPTND